VNNVIVGATEGINKQSYNTGVNKTFNDVGGARGRNNVPSLNARTKSKSQSRVPGLDFSNLK
jgi:hypothetical protein